MGFAVEAHRSTNESNQTYTNNSNNVNQQINNTGNSLAVGRDFSIYNLIIIQGSQDYKNLKNIVEKARKNLEKIPNDSDFIEELKKSEENLENFTRDILKLADEICKIPLNSERGIKAKNLFNRGEYQAAREILNIEEMSREQQALINKQQQLAHQQEDITAQLNNLSGEFILKAKLTAVDFQLGDKRIAKTREYFEQALISERNPEYLSEYAFFLQDNRFYISALEIYKEVLRTYQELAKKNPDEYQPYVAVTFHNIASLQAPSCNCRIESESIYQENLKFYRELAKNNPDMYMHGIAMTLNGLGSVVGADSSRHLEAEKIYQENLKIYRELAKNNPGVFLSSVAGALNNLGVLVSNGSNRQNEAKEYFQESLKIYRGLAKDIPAMNLSIMAGVLNNLGNLVASDNSHYKEAEAYYQESLRIYRELAKDNPMKYQPGMAGVLAGLGKLYLDQKQTKIAVIYLQEAQELFAFFPKESEEMHLSELDAFIYNNELSRLETLLKEAKDTK
ncbi:MAG: tetratricopeptide repeat protein [Nitrosomonas sp.]|uniref:tetratricopeptide repeat protein n=1 Tax=Nitrosomonas sp. TaxID=42353 RepID=UPI002732E98D|nr:tetratricopeptide repeat protein [Nitrosomonas sp.]MDP3662053.1 tetratricopeptide repeat protein [Nitrosomonas sp.]MDZ4106482.1 tetratricopeptide repeat protein [Nitrosomonas sp.]